MSLDPTVLEGRVLLVLELSREEEIVDIPNEDVPADELLELRIETL